MTVRTDEHIRARCFHPKGTFVKFPPEDVETSIPERFENIVSKFPDRLAIKTNEDAITYDELNKDANRLARSILRRRGRETQPIGLLLDHDASVIAALLGTLKAGKFFVPLDPSCPESRLRYVLKDSRASLLVTNSRNLPLARRLVHDSDQIVNSEELDAGFSNDNLGLQIPSVKIVSILYTSGSTGQPKGVLQNHQNLLHFTMTYTNDLHICPADRLTLLHYCSVSAAMRNLFGALLNGAAIFPFDLRRTVISNLPAWLIEQGITIYHSAPTVFRHFMASLTDKVLFPQLRLINLSGEAATKSDALQYKAIFSPDCVFVNMWGATETGFISQFFIDKESAIPGHMLPLGYGIQDKEILLLDDSGRKVGFNEIGEITVRSRYLSPGYWDRPDMNRIAYLFDPREANNRIYRTGDLARMLQDGCLLYLERKDFQVKIRGNRVELAEAEAALLEHPEIKEGVIVAKEDQLHNLCLVAYVTSNTKPAPSTGMVRDFLKEKVPEYMIPSAIVWLDALPRTPSGKIDRNTLPAPEQGISERQDSLVPPSNPTEQTLVQIWADTLKLDHVGINDNFFDLGGHSLNASQIVSRVFQHFRVQIPIQALYESPTVAEMAAVIKEHKGDNLTVKELEQILTEVESLSEDEVQKRVSESSSPVVKNK